LLSDVLLPESGNYSNQDSYYFIFCLFLMPDQRKILAYVLLLAFLWNGCSNSTINTAPTGQGVDISLYKLYPSRTGESYALWFEVPVASAGGKQNQIQHSNTKQKFVGSFRVAADGSKIDLDTTNLLQRLGAPLALAIRGIISIEKTGQIDTAPAAQFMAGDITGSASTGTATLTTTSDDGLNYDYSSMTGAITLANAPGKPASDLELYLMRATSPTQISASINNLPLLQDEWQYTLWAVDSSTKSLPPFNIYYGSFVSPIDVDSQPNDNHYNYPGGRYPADSTQPIYDLRSGRVTVMMTLEPITGGARPSVPFGAIILQTTIPSSAQGFSPIELTNRAAQFPTAKITIYR
jgi:hypothetical protein